MSGRRRPTWIGLGVAVLGGLFASPALRAEDVLPPGGTSGATPAPASERQVVRPEGVRDDVGAKEEAKEEEKGTSRSPASVKDPSGETASQPTVPTGPETAPDLSSSSQGFLAPLTLMPPLFSEDRDLDSRDEESGDDGWAFNFHGYLRAPLRFHGSPKRARPPYLVDDNYFQSGFAYTRVNETEYAELFLGASYGRTRFAAGILATQFSDWSETTLQGQSGIATAFVEHDWVFQEKLAELGVRAGMFWDRFGYIAPYDTYLLGRLHMAGLRLKLRLFDVWESKIGFGAHSDVTTSNQGFTPVFFVQSGIDMDIVRAGLFFGMSWTGDSQREFSLIQDGSLRVIGGEGTVAIPNVGMLHGTVGFYRARHVQFLANGYEVLHSTGGRGLTQNFFGPNSDSGTGEALVFGAEFDWQVARTVAAFDEGSARYFKGLDVKLFGMLAWLASNQASDNPLENFDQRVYFKWGIEPTYRPHLPGWDVLFVSLRFDRVILDMSHSSMAFRVLTPKIGVTPVRDPDLDIFISYSKYDYGDNVTLRPNQIPGDLSVTQPDGDVFKIQAQLAW